MLTLTVLFGGRVAGDLLRMCAQITTFGNLEEAVIYK